MIPSSVPQNKSSVRGWLAMHVATLHRGTDCTEPPEVSAATADALLKIFKHTFLRLSFSSSKVKPPSYSESVDIGRVVVTSALLPLHTGFPLHPTSGSALQVELKVSTPLGLIMATPHSDPSSSIPVQPNRLESQGSCTTFTSCPCLENSFPVDRKEKKKSVNYSVIFPRIIQKKSHVHVHMVC